MDVQLSSKYIKVMMLVSTSPEGKELWGEKSKQGTSQLQMLFPFLDQCDDEAGIFAKLCIYALCMF